LLHHYSQYSEYKTYYHVSKAGIYLSAVCPCVSLCVSMPFRKKKLKKTTNEKM